MTEPVVRVLVIMVQGCGQTRREQTAVSRNAAGNLRICSTCSKVTGNVLITTASLLLS